MYLINASQVPSEPFLKEGARNVKVKWLIHQPVGANNFFLRCYYIEKGGQTPLDEHAWEHEVYVLEGRGVVLGGEREVEIKPGDAIYIPSNERHQFKNVSDETLVLLCVRGAESLYAEK